MATHSVNIAQMKVSSAPDNFSAPGLGSCICLALYDPMRKIGGMIHVLLPNAADVPGADNMTKFANPGIYKLVEALVKEGADRYNLVAKLAGGADMLKAKNQVGQRNLDESLRILKELHIKVLAQDVGGTTGRSVTFELENGTMCVSTLTKGKKVI